MSSALRDLPLDARIKLVEDLWDSIAADQGALGLTQGQRLELDRRLEAFASDGDQGRLVEEVFAEIRQKL